MRYLLQITFAFFALTSAVVAGPGDFDTTFNGTGKLFGGFGLGNDVAFSSAVQPDGKLIVAGSASNGSGSFFIARYNSDGTLDLSFGDGGKRTALGMSAVEADIELAEDGTILVPLVIDGKNRIARFSADGAILRIFDPVSQFAWEDFQIRSISIDGGGKILAAGTYHTASDRSFGVYRFNPDGTRDNSFGIDGKMVIDFGANEELTDMTIMPDHSILLSGTIRDSNANIAVAKLRSNGILDRTFDRDGKLVPIAITTDNAFTNSAVAVQKDGKIVLAGLKHSTVLFSTESNLHLARLNLNGTMDSDFGINGEVVFDGTEDYGWTQGRNGILIHNDGRITASTNGDNKIYLHRFGANGSIDSTFGNNGVYTVNDAVGYGLSKDNSGRILVSGTQYTGTLLNKKLYDSLVMRFDISNIPDANFGLHGKALLDIGNMDSAAADVEIQSDNKIMIVGGVLESPNAVPQFFGAARYNEDGTPDLTFNGSGRTLLQIGRRVFDSAIQADGKLVMVGQTNNSRFCLIRLNVNGSLDMSFNGSGIVIPDLGADGVAKAVALQPDGKILVAGETNQDFVIARLNLDGSLDSSFNYGGYTVTNIGNRKRSLDEVFAMSLQADGKIVVAGNSRFPVTATADSAIVRYQSHGTIDYGFGLDGIALNSFSGWHDSVGAMDILPDGKIVTAGPVSVSSSQRTLGVVSYNANGTVDSSFGQNGISLPDPGNQWYEGYAIKAQKDGKLLITGTETIASIRRLNVNGNVDVTFGDGGKVIFGTPFSGSFNKTPRLVFDPAGRVIVSGSHLRPWMARLFPDAN